MGLHTDREKKIPLIFQNLKAVEKSRAPSRKILLFLIYYAFSESDSPLDVSYLYQEKNIDKYLGRPAKFSLINREKSRKIAKIGSVESSNFYREFGHEFFQFFLCTL